MAFFKGLILHAVHCGSLHHSAISAHAHLQHHWQRSRPSLTRTNVAYMDVYTFYHLEMCATVFFFLCACYFIVG